MTSDSHLAWILTYVKFLTEGGYGLQILLCVETVKGCNPPCPSELVIHGVKLIVYWGKDLSVFQHWFHVEDQ